jgi:hypothetical protein
MADVLSVIADVLKQDKQQKREHNKMMKEVQKKLKEKDSEEVAEEPGDKEDYMKFFAGKLKKYGVKSPSELDAEQKKKFFNEIEKDWKHDSSEEVEVEEKEEDLGKRVKSRMEAEDEEEDEDEAPVGDQDEPETEPEEDEESEEDEVDMDEPSEDQIDKIADLVVQKLKDKADEEEEEEQEPDSTEAEGGKEEEIDTKPKVEHLHRNPHHRGMWEDALKKVYTIESAQDTPQQLDEHCGVCDEQGLEEKVEPKTKKEETIKEEICPECGQELPCDCGYVKEGNDKPIEDAAKKVQHNWKRMSTKDKVKFKDKMDDLASKNRVSDADLEEILDDYGLTEGKESIGMTFLRKHYSKDKQ